MRLRHKHGAFTDFQRSKENHFQSVQPAGEQGWRQGLKPGWYEI